MKGVGLMKVREHLYPVAGKRYAKNISC
ncbi:MAG: hypothetical protein JWM79_3982, partial [Nocardioides sp.]|nr:hypothetical protein [Nocardioides sp.]